MTFSGSGSGSVSMARSRLPSSPCITSWA